MTISYSLEAASSKSFKIHKLMLKWKGSVWQCVWQNLLLWLICYTVISVTYRCLLPLWPDTVRHFEDVSVFCQRYTEFIPITFLLGFYVNFVIQRWWDQYNCLGWVDTPCFFIATYVRGTDETARIVRRSCARYLSLAQILLYRDISPVIRKRFPTTQHLIDANVLTEEESVSLDTLETPYHKYFVPIQWTCTLLAKARDDGHITSDDGFGKTIKAVTSFRTSLGTLFSYDWVSIPLVYTQVVALGVKSYFVICLLGRQYLDTSKGYPQSEVDFYVPIFTILQFIFYIGWLGVAEVLMNPLGEDDEDFETNFIISRNLQLGLTIVDDNFGVIPTLRRDAFWDDAKVELPHTEASQGKADDIPIGSCAELEVPKEEQKVVEPTALSAATSERNSLSEEHGLPMFHRRKKSIHPQPSVRSQNSLKPSDSQQIINQIPSDAERQVNEELFYNHLPRFAKIDSTPNMSRKRSHIAQDYLQRRQRRSSDSHSNRKESTTQSTTHSVNSSANGDVFLSPNSFVAPYIMTELAQENASGRNTPRSDHSSNGVVSAGDVGVKSITPKPSRKRSTKANDKDNESAQPGFVTAAAASDHAGFSSPLAVIEEMGSGDEASRQESFESDNRKNSQTAAGDK